MRAQTHKTRELVSIIRVAQVELGIQLSQQKAKRDVKVKLLRLKLTQSPSEDLYKDLLSIFEMDRRQDGIQEVMNSLANLSKNAKVIVESKAPPIDLINDFRTVLIAGQILGQQTLLKIGKKTFKELYGKSTVKSLSDPQFIPAALSNAFLNAEASPSLLLSRIQKLSDSEKLDYNTLCLICEKSLPQSFGDTQSLMGPDSVYKPADFPPFHRESWPEIVRGVRMAEYFAREHFIN